MKDKSEKATKRFDEIDDQQKEGKKTVKAIDSRDYDLEERRLQRIAEIGKQNDFMRGNNQTYFIVVQKKKDS